jgi:hypothetical protein
VTAPTAETRRAALDAMTADECRIALGYLLDRHPDAFDAAANTIARRRRNRGDDDA